MEENENTDAESSEESIKTTSDAKSVLLESKSEDSPEGKRENTRSKIAHFYVYAFFGTILLSFIVGLINCFSVKDYGDLLITVSGILSGPLGFIIGYYFKASSRDQ